MARLKPYRGRCIMLDHAPLDHAAIDIHAPLERIAIDMRSRLYANEYRCLSSFLHDLAERCCGGKGEAGVVAVADGDLVLRRVSRTPSEFVAIRDVIKAEIETFTVPVPLSSKS